MNRLVFQSDFGLVDGAVSAMKGISYGVDPQLIIEDLTHDIPAFNVWEASYRLHQTVQYWPENTVFVSVVDPGVGSARKSVVAKLKGEKYVVTPDNGTLTHLYHMGEILEVREIDETINRVQGSEKMHTFHGRDVYAYTGARLTSEVIDFTGVGSTYPLDEVVLLDMKQPEVDGDVIRGSIDILDIRFGSLWSNIPSSLFEKNGIDFGDRLNVKISHRDRVLYNNFVTYGRSFSQVNIGETIIYINSLDYIALAINQGNFSKAYNIETGLNWIIEFSKIEG